MFFCWLHSGRDPTPPPPVRSSCGPRLWRKGVGGSRPTGTSPTADSGTNWLRCEWSHCTCTGRLESEVPTSALDPSRSWGRRQGSGHGTSRTHTKDGEGPPSSRRDRIRGPRAGPQTGPSESCRTGVEGDVDQETPGRDPLEVRPPEGHGAVGTPPREVRRLPPGGVPVRAVDVCAGHSP